MPEDIRKEMKTRVKYIPKKLTTIVYIALICVGALLAVSKWAGVFGGNFTILPDEINSHITNFSISLIFYLGVGYSWLLFRAKIRSIIILGLVLLAANFICETLMASMNTVDVVDAIYGTVGTIVGFVFLWVANKYGFLKEAGNEQ